MEQKTEFYTPDELAAKLNIARKTVTKHTQARRIPGQVKIGGQWRYRVVEIEKALLRGNLLLPVK
jgi:excisionase family DNA binding protein